ncbi:MAG: radical SAM protein, partial [Kiritimatiellae bacterium]|nr:radical SAM protein [Kiritimatiellia bacterium]
LGDTTIVDIGLQSTNPKTIKEIHRHYSEEKFSVGIRHLMEAGLATNVYLIPGLPYETFSTALRGVCFLINQRPTRIFLNELCLLNGTELRERAEEYGYEFDDAPPYYVKSSRWISAPVLSILCRAAKDLVRRYNLSFASLSLRSKVLQDYNNMRDGVVVVNLGGGCGWSCSGCRDSGRRDSNDPSVDISELCSLSMGKDVEIVVGDYIELQVLLNVAAQFQLSGAQRIKLVAPLTFFRDIDDITKMVNTGIWHYRTFVGSICGDVDNIVLDFHKVRESIQLLGRKFKVNGFGVRPHLEVVLLSSEDDVPELQSMIEVVRKEAESIAMPSLAGDAEFLNGLFADAVTSEEVKELVKSSAGSARTAGRDYWPKVSETAVRQVFNESEDLDLVCKYLEDLDLLSDGHVCPPCFRAVV